MKRRLAFILGCMVLVLALSGCAMLSKDKSKENILEPQPTFKFSDVPVPSGFKMIGEESYSFETQGVRVGLLKYYGKGDVDQVVNFYREQMAMYNWTLLNVVEYGQRLMNFDREAETCIVNIQPKGTNAMTVTIAVGPKASQVLRRAKTIK